MQFLVAGARSEMDKCLTEVSAIVEAQPKPLVRQWRILFFPERDPNGSFRFLVNRVLLWLCIMAVVAGLFGLGWQWLGNIHSERQNQSAVFREPPPAAPSQVPSPNPTISMRRHRSASRPKKTDSLAAVSSSIPDSVHTP